MICRARPPHIESGQQENAHGQIGDQAAHYHDRKGALGIGADRVGQGGRQQTERGYQHSHHNRPEAARCAFNRGVQDRHSSGAQLIDVFHHDDAGLDRDTEQGHKADVGRDAEVCPGHVKSHKPSHTRHPDIDQVQARPLGGTEGAVDNQPNYEDGQGDDNKHSSLRALFALVFTLPVNVIAARKLNLFAYLLDRFFDGTAQGTVADAVLDRDVPLVRFAIDFGAFVPLFNFAELPQRDPLARGRQQADVLDGLFCAAELREIAHYQVVTRLALQYLGESVSSRGGINSVLNVRDVDLVTRGLPTIYHEVVVGLAGNSKNTQVGDSPDRAHNVDDLFGFVLKNPQILAIDLGGKLSLDPADGFLHVVGDGLGEAPDHARQLRQLAVHGRDDCIFVLVKCRAPLLLGLQIGEILRIKKAGSVGSVVRTPSLTGALAHLGKRTKDEPRLIR